MTTNQLDQLYHMRKDFLSGKLEYEDYKKMVFEFLEKHSSSYDVDDIVDRMLDKE